MKLAVLGPGLLGGSLLLACLERSPATRLTAWSRDPAELAALAALERPVRATGDLAAAVADASLVVLCVPPAAIVALGERLAPHLAPGAVVTDVGSVKTPIVAALGRRFAGRFVGGHPMAGRERGGLGMARADLFEGALCLLTPEPDTDPAAVARVETFWRSLGCRAVHLVSAAEHDRAVALVSHLPHLLAGALLAVTDPAARACAGPGFRDSTRLAAGPPELWKEILSLNRVAVKGALLALAGELRRLADGPLSSSDADADAELETYLRRANQTKWEVGSGKREVQSS